MDLDRVRDAWSKAGIENYVLGEFDAPAPGNTVLRDGMMVDLPELDVDPFWDLFFAELA